MLQIVCIMKYVGECNEFRKERHENQNGQVGGDRVMAGVAGNRQWERVFLF